MNKRKTKIICTLGPATDNEDVLRKLIINGMNVARFNFSHGTYEEHGRRLAMLRRLCKELNMPVAALMDTKGPEIRTGHFVNKGVNLQEGTKVVISHEDVLGTAEKFSVSYKDMDKDLKKGDQILIDDGLVGLRVESIEDRDIHCVCTNSGPVSDYKSINLPEINTNLPALTEKDVEDLKYAATNDFDFIAASFIRKAADVIAIKRILKEYGAAHYEIISKIENREGVRNFNEILAVSDGIMIARGDLGVEIPVEEVPAVQKMMVHATYKAGKPCVTATQMLDSMIRNPRPTRAEVTDVANAIYDGSSATMLSGETAAGKYPVESLQMMDKVARFTESKIDYWKRFEQERHSELPSVSTAISHACCTTAMDLNAKAIMTVTMSGRTARAISRFRPACPIVATTVSERVLRNLQLAWGVQAFLVKIANKEDDLFAESIALAEQNGIVAKGDVVVETCGKPLGLSGTTNSLMVQNVGNILSKGLGYGNHKVTGEIMVLKSTDFVENLEMPHGTIIVAKRISEKHLPIIRGAAALVVESQGSEDYTKIAGSILDIPVLVGCENATKILKNGSIATLDPDRGIIY